MPHRWPCEVHPHAQPICPGCLAAAGGRKTSPEKRRATALSLAKARAAKAAKKEQP